MLASHQQRNLGERARERSVTTGVVFAALALGWALLCGELGLSPSLRWLVAIPATFSTYLLISGTLGICAYNGMKGSRTDDHGHEAVLDPANRSQLRLRALAAVTASLLIATTLAAALAAAG
jgi:hypothetical protein